MHAEYLVCYTCVCVCVCVSLSLSFSLCVCVCVCVCFVCAPVKWNPQTYRVLGCDTHTRMSRK